MNAMQDEKKRIFFYICMNKKDLNEDIVFTDTSLNIEKLSDRDITVGNEEYTISVFYMENEKGKNNNKIELKFKIDGKDYKLKIECKEKAKIFFNFKTTLEQDKKFGNSKIEFKFLTYKDKFLSFDDALTKSENFNNEDYEKELVEEGINFLDKEKTFDYFILLFSHCYKKN